MKLINLGFRLFCCAVPLAGFLLAGCTVKAVGDPNRPITIQAHITVDVKGLKETATNIEDYVSGDPLPIGTKDKEGKK